MKAVSIPEEATQFAVLAGNGRSFGTRAGVVGIRITPRADGVLTKDFASSN